MITQVVKIHQRTLNKHWGYVHTNPGIFDRRFVIALLESNFQTIRFRCPDVLGSLSNAPDDGDGNENGKLQKV